MRSRIMPAVGLDLGFAGAAEEAEAAALALEVGPAADQAPGLIIEVGKLDLQPAFGGRRALAENLEDQPGAVDDLGPDLVLQVLLLDRGQRANRRSADARPRAFASSASSSTWPLPSRVAGRTARTRNGVRRHDVDADRFGKPFGFLEPRLGRAPRALARKLGHGDHRALAARDLDRAIAVEIVQASLLRLSRRSARG